MRSLLLTTLFFNLFSLPLSAQVTQGGPPDDQIITDTTVNWKVDDASIITLMDIKSKKLMPSLEVALNACLNKKKKAFKVKDISGFYQIFLTETFFDSLRQIEKELEMETKGDKPLRESACSQEDDIKKRCMQERVDQELLKDFLNTSVTSRYFELKLGLNIKDAKHLLRVMKDLEKK
jgi:hypothetical protein